MNTVVMFVATGKSKTSVTPEGGWRNRLYTRSLRKIGFIDNRYPKDGVYPKPNEHWLVEILRENQNERGGCFILRPLRLVNDHGVLVHGMYEIAVTDGCVILTPNDTDPTKFWVMSPAAKKAVLDAHVGASSLLINHGGEPWQKRRAAESFLASEAKRLLE